jgi:hypothetical protein
MFAKCPKCEKPMTYVSGYSPDIKMTGGGSWRGLVIACPHCQTALSAAVDPIAIKADIIAKIKTGGR